MSCSEETSRELPSLPSPGRSVVFFDLETTIPLRKGQPTDVIEFAAVVITLEGFYETHAFSTLIRPRQQGQISPRSVACNGITEEAVKEAPFFQDVADRIFDLLHGQIWAGHNIGAFDSVRLRAAFHSIERRPPEASGVVDTLPLLREKFGPRAGNFKMASLAEYCGLGNQAHRSLEDVRMNVAILKQCAAMLFLESSFGFIQKTSSPPAVQVSRGEKTDFFSQRKGKTNSGKSKSLSPQVAGVQISTIEISEKAEFLRSGAGEEGGREGREREEREAGEERGERETKDFGFRVQVNATMQTSLSDIRRQFDEELNGEHRERVCEESVEDFREVGRDLSAQFSQLWKNDEDPGERRERGEDGERVGGGEWGEGGERVRDEQGGGEREGQRDWGRDVEKEKRERSGSRDVYVAPERGRGGIETQKINSELLTYSRSKPIFSKFWHIELLYAGAPLLLYDRRMRVRYSVNDRFGSCNRPKLSLLVEPSDATCRAIRACDDIIKASADVTDESI